MTPSPLIDDRTRTNRSRRRSTGNARARAKPLSLSALTPPAREAYGGHDNRGEQEAATRHKMHHIKILQPLGPPGFRSEAANTKTGEISLHAVDDALINIEPS